MENNKIRGGMRRKKVCQFCADKTEAIDYKDGKTQEVCNRKRQDPAKENHRNLRCTSERSNEGNQESKNRSSAALHC